uniref:BTB domain-containing protein n=1 Tax=Panagrellus redivivus TaxID=6233 RepID=A0A7E4V6N9_PANRE
MFYEDAVAERESEFPMLTKSDATTISKPTLTTPSKPLNFVYNWVITVPSLDQARMPLSTHFSTTYGLGSTDWNVHLKHRAMVNSFLHRNRAEPTSSGSHVIIETARSAKMLTGKCWIQYSIFSDEDMGVRTFESAKMQAVGTETFLNEGLRFRTPMTENFFDRFASTYKTKPGYKIHVNIELCLDIKYFIKGYESTTIFLNRFMKPFPVDVDSHFLFSFLKNHNFTINCADGVQVYADKRSIYLTSAYFRNMEDFDKLSEINTHFTSDVVRPVIWYLHSLCFELPKDCTLEYVRKVMRYVEIVNPANKLDIQACIHRSLCLKAAQNIDNYPLLVELAELSAPSRMMELKQIVCTVIADRYYERFKNDFPDGNINVIRDAPVDDIFHGLPFIGQTPSEWIDRIYRGKFRTAVIVP